MKYYLNLNDRPFDAILAGAKKIEGRVPTPPFKTPFEKIKEGDLIVFTKKANGEKFEAEVLGVRHYKDTRSMLEKEGVENVLSSRGNIEQGIESYNSFEDYKENITKYGIYAIEVKPLV